MSEDRIQRQMDFILEQQARFAEDIDQLKEENRQATSNIAKLADVVMSLAHHVERHDQEIAALIEQGKETSRLFKETDQRFKDIGERLNAIINLFERFISENGK